MIDAPGIAPALELWFSAAQRDLPWRRAYDPYHVWLAEVMLQQTRMDVVVPYFERFIARFPTVESLAASSPDEVLTAWSGLGYYRRARMLHAGARHVVNEYGGALPRTAGELQTIPGIGRYTAGAIASMAFEEAAPVVDGNVSRVLARVAMLDAPAGSARLLREQWMLAARLVEASGSPRLFNQAMMELGALVCTPRLPQCDLCPISTRCAAFRAARVEEFPVVARNAPPIELEVPLLIVRDGTRILLQRHEGRLMDGMFHLPHGSDVLIADSSNRFVRRRELGRFTHTITNRRVVFVVHEAEPRDSVAEARQELVWVDADTLTRYPHPSYVMKALRIASNDASASGRSRRRASK